ncbi:MAG: PIG-L family deacetylase [Actinomycetota bacterium]|nr:PIG-L family deacetylase [Actinomycetota bacterium]
MSRLYLKVPLSALAFYAHPDDADVSCGGTMALWAELGARVDLVVCTKGEKGTIDASKDVSELESERLLELENAKTKLGISELVNLYVPDGGIENTARFRAEIVRLIRQFKPEAVLCPDPTAVFFGTGYFNHRDHRELGWTVLDSVSPAASLPHYFPSEGPPHQVSTVLMSGSLEADAFVDVSASIKKKVDAVLCHRSQIGDREEWMSEVISTRAKETGKAIGVGYAEAFRLLELGS